MSLIGLGKSDALERDALEPDARIGWSSSAPNRSGHACMSPIVPGTQVDYAVMKRLFGFYFFLSPFLLLSFLLPLSPLSPLLDPRSGPPLKLAVAGLVHGHVSGFLRAAEGRTDVQIVGVF